LQAEFIEFVVCVLDVRQTVEVAQQYHHGFWIVFLELDLFRVAFLRPLSASIVNSASSKSHLPGNVLRGAT
jgi:hypothetical protein